MRSARRSAVGRMGEMGAGFLSDAVPAYALANAILLAEVPMLAAGRADSRISDRLLSAKCRSDLVSATRLAPQGAARTDLGNWMMYGVIAGLSLHPDA